MNNTSDKNEIKYLYSVTDQKYAKIDFVNKNKPLSWVTTKEEASSVEIAFFGNLGRLGEWLYLFVLGLTLKKKLIFKRELYISTASSLFKTLNDLDNMSLKDVK